MRGVSAVGGGATRDGRRSPEIRWRVSKRRLTRALEVERER